MFLCNTLNSELHPHEFTKFIEERVWLFDDKQGIFSEQIKTVGIHITHNGDFNALEGYDRTIVNGDIGQWLARILHTTHTLKGDSPKIAGFFDVFRVQGRWAASARLGFN